MEIPQHFPHTLKLTIHFRSVKPHSHESFRIVPSIPNGMVTPGPRHLTQATSTLTME